MKKIILAVMLFFTTFCLGFAEEVSFSIGEGIPALIKFSEDCVDLRQHSIYAVIPYQDGYIIKFCVGNDNQLIEFFAKVGSVFYLSDGNKTFPAKIVKISPNHFTIDY